MIIPKINSESISGMISGISKELKQAGFWLLLANTENQEREEVEYLKLFSENQVDGIILIGTIFTPAHKRAPVSYTHLDVYKRQTVNGCIPLQTLVWNPMKF